MFLGEGYRVGKVVLFGEAKHRGLARYALWMWLRGAV